MRRAASSVLAAAAVALSPAAADARPAQPWKAAFVSAPAFADPTYDFGGRTIRAVGTPQFGGKRARIVLTNRFGDRPLVLPRSSIGLLNARGDRGLVPGSHRPLRFGGARRVVIPAHGEVTSDPVRLQLTADSPVAVSAYVPPGSPLISTHPKAWQHSWHGLGNQVDSVDGAGLDTPFASRPLLERIDVRAPRRTRVLVAVGESRTDGTGSTVDLDERWPDQLARRAAGFGRPISVVNAALGGNRLNLRPGPETGPSLRKRLQNDVLRVPGVTGVILFYGGNDLALPPYDSQAQVRAGIRAVVKRLKRRGIRVTLATMTPSEGYSYYSRPDYERERTKLNRWIRGSEGLVDVADFDAALRDPGDPRYLNPAYDLGDRLHFSPAGFQRLAEEVDLPRAAGKVPSAAPRRTSSTAGGR